MSNMSSQRPGAGGPANMSQGSSGMNKSTGTSVSSAASEIGSAVRQGADGVGLLRTEFLFLDRAQPPDEAEKDARGYLSDLVTNLVRDK